MRGFKSARACSAVHGVFVLFAAATLTYAAVNDAVVQDVRIVGNTSIPSAQLQQLITLKAGGALTRAIVLADVKRIESVYQRQGKQVAIATDLTHPGEHAGAPVTTLTYTINENSKPPKLLDADDPLEIYYDNTLVCAAAKTLNDLCHLWLNRDGSFINFDAGEAKTGHYSVGPMRADGKVPVCQYWDNTRMLSPAEIRPPMGPPPPANAAPTAAAAAAPRVMICRNDNNRTSCQRGVDPATLSEADRKYAGLNMGQRWHLGMCYPIGPHQLGDVWFESDDPLPGQLDMDRMLLIKGRQ